MTSNWTRIQIGVLVLLFLVFTMGAGLYTDYLWFQSMGYAVVFNTILKSKLWIGTGAAIVMFLFATINAMVAGRSYAVSRNVEGETEVVLPENLNTLVLLVIGAVSILFGTAASGSWERVLRYLNRTAFGISDPVFGKDAAFYIFSLPFFQALLRAGYAILVVTAIIILIVYLMKSKSLIWDMTFQDIKFETPKFTSWAKTHLFILLALFFILLAMNYHLQGYELLQSSRSDSYYGPGYADLTATLPVLRFMVFLSIVTAASFLLNAWLKKPWISLGLIAILIGANILALGVYPGLVQEYRVLPNELRLETPYIEQNINFTNMAYGLDEVEERPFDIKTNLTDQDIRKNRPTIDNIRLWDPRPLESTYKQLQEIRLYYEFNDVDVDRYNINGDFVEVMLSAREIDTRDLEAKAQNWINEHLIFTHGYGVVASPVNKKTSQGLPELLIKNIPPESTSFNITRPEIYYGEITDKYVIVNTREEELDFPEGDVNRYTTYTEESGVKLDSYLKKLAFSMRFATTRILLSRDINSESRILFNRNIRAITGEITPFLFYDRDPYMVISEGKLYWMLDGYVVTSKYPYSTPIGGINYIRNPVKTVVDAYTGETSFYLVDPDEPLIRTYSKIFQGLFKSFDEMPPDLKLHIRYPEDMFTLQAEAYSKFHMKEPRVFYNSEDLWNIPNERYEDSTIKMVPYYIIMELPSEDKEEFLLMQPFTPVNKDIMIAWMYGRSDPEHYGKLGVFKFTKQEQIFGPMQVEALIDQDSAISSQLSLWDQAGSKVIRGNLLVIPIEESILYVEPLYLRAEKGQLPQLVRVVMAYGDRIVMEEDLEGALNALFGSRLPQPSERPSIEDGTPAAKALTQYYRALDELKAGNWSQFGIEIKKLEDLLRELEKPESIA